MTVNLESARAAVRVAVAHALAEALITGIDNAAEEGHTLTQVQQIDIAVMSMLAAHSAIQEGEANLGTEARFAETVRRSRA